MPLVGRPLLITSAKVDQLETLTGQLKSIHSELSALGKKSPNVAVNKFKLKFINRVLSQCNSFLRKQYKPFDEFTEFDVDDIPSNSDVTFIVAHYMQATEKFRSDNITEDGVDWYYDLDGEEEPIPTAPPAKLRK